MQINLMVPGAMQVSLISTPHCECEELAGLGTPGDFFRTYLQPEQLLP